MTGDWIRERVEPPNAMQITDTDRKKLLARLIRSTMYVRMYVSINTRDSLRGVLEKSIVRSNPRQGCIQKFCQGGGGGKFGVWTKEGGQSLYKVLHPTLAGGGGGG